VDALHSPPEGRASFRPPYSPPEGRASFRPPYSPPEGRASFRTPYGAGPDAVSDRVYKRARASARRLWRESLAFA